MKVLLLPLLASFALAVRADSSCEDNCEHCTDVHDILTISCDVPEAGCSITSNAGYVGDEEEKKLDNFLGEPEITQITADECRQKCQQQADTEGDTELAPTSGAFCQFFHWELGYSRQGKATTCSLQTKCPDSGGYCDNNQCVSGQLGCNDNCDPLIPCTLASKTVWNHDKFHVICTDNIGDVNIYSDEVGEIANGTICNTIRKCSTWEDIDDPSDSVYYRKLAVECFNGVWQPRVDAGSQAVSAAMKEGGIITEQPCDAKCEEVDIGEELSTQWWADLVCDHPLAEGNKLVEPNSCILLCDNHLSKSIDCKYTEEGTKTWQDAHGKTLLTDDIKC